MIHMYRFCRTFLASLLLLSGVRAFSATYTNPVCAGDLPDPSVIRVGNEYWATATSSEWAPQFPLLRSPDLVNWEIVGAVFSNQPPWAVANFWAPEIQEWKGRYYVYYVARQKDGPLSVAVGTAERPGGPYTDHGVIVAQDVGSIDPVAVDDENGARYLVWKDDGNSRKQPTHLWAAKLNEDGTRLAGPHTPLFKNDLPWEGAVIEGPFIVRRDGWFYLFYSGAGCCGQGCNYALGVARSRKLLGPWEKFPGNPILAGNEVWLCPGHGSIVQDKNDRYWLMYHAYSSEGSVTSGRQALLDEVRWEANGWPVINGGKGPSTSAETPTPVVQARNFKKFRDEFSGTTLGPGWNWGLNRPPVSRFDSGYLLLRPPRMSNDGLGVLGRSIPSGDFVASTALALDHLSAAIAAGLAVWGDRNHAAGIEVELGRMLVWEIRQGKRQVTAEAAVPKTSLLHLRMQGKAGREVLFEWSTDGSTWKALGQPVGDRNLPPWDRALRAVMVVRGPVGQASFDYFSLEALN